MKIRCWLKWLLLLVSLTEPANAGPLDHYPQRRLATSEVPGRLVAFGQYATKTGQEVDLASSLSAEAQEGFVEISADANNWVARRADGTLLDGGPGWLSQRHLVTPFPVVQMSEIRSGQLAFLMEGGAVHALWAYGKESGYPFSGENSGFVAVGVTGNIIFGLREEGTLELVGAETTLPILVEGFAEYQGRISQMFLGDWVGAVRLKNGDYLYFHTSPKWAVVRPMFLPGNATYDQISQLIAHGDAFHVLLKNGDVYRTRSKHYMEKDNLPIPLPHVFDSSSVQKVVPSGKLVLCATESGDWITVSEEALPAVFTDTAFLRDLTAFQVGYRKAIPERRYVLGIAASKNPAPAPVPDREVPELTTLLTKIETASTAAGGLAEFEERYLSGLNKLKPSVQGKVGPTTELEDEIANFRDTTRTLSNYAPIAKLQSIYRTNVGQKIAKRDAATPEIYRSGIDQLKALQDKLTRDRRIQDAVVVRAAWQRMEAEFAKSKIQQPAKTPPAAAVVAQNIPPLGDKIFTTNHASLEGTMKVWGILKGNPIEQPRKSEAEGVIAIGSHGGGWFALAENGRIDSSGIAKDSSREKDINDLPPLASFCSNFNSAYGVDRKGRLHEWTNKKNPEPVPEGLPKLKTCAFVSHHFAGLAEDGSVVGWGPYFSRKISPFVVPAGNDFIKVAVGDEFGCALTSKGELKLWGNAEKFVLPEALATDIADFAIGRFYLTVVKTDGSVKVWAGDPNHPRNNVPVGLADIVAITASQERIAALRADGQWFGWGVNQQGWVDALTEFAGCRQLVLSESTEPDTEYVIGLLPVR